MTNGPKKLVLINSGKYDYAEVELGGSLQLVGPNNTGKTTLISTLQFLYIDDRSQMKFGSHSAEETATYYFPSQYSYVLFECLGVRGSFVLGWRGHSKLTGADPQRFFYEGEFERDDFFDEGGRVREPDDVKARLSLKHFKLLKTAQQHRELLLLPTKGEPQSTGIVALRQTDNFHNFRETLKNLLTLSSVTQEQMRDRLLMLAGMSENRLALDIRKVFGESYEEIIRRRKSLVAFKTSRGKVEALLSVSVDRTRLRTELMYRWNDLRDKKGLFEEEYRAGIAEMEAKAKADVERAGKLDGEVNEARKALGLLNQAQGNLKGWFERLQQKAIEFVGFEDNFPEQILKNLNADIERIAGSLESASTETQETAKKEVEKHRKEVARLEAAVKFFDRALVTTLREQFEDQDLEVLAQLFSYDLLQLPVGDDGIHLQNKKRFFSDLKAIRSRISDGIYRDGNVEIPLAGDPARLSTLTDLPTLKGQLRDAKRGLARWVKILATVSARDELMGELAGKRDEAQKLGKKIFDWEQYQATKAHEQAKKQELSTIEGKIADAEAQIGKSVKEAGDLRASAARINNSKKQRETSHGEIVARHAGCVFPNYEGLPTAPFESIPAGFELAVDSFIKQQRRLEGLDSTMRDALVELERLLGTEYTGLSEDETIDALKQALEALSEREEALQRDWGHQFQELRATFDQVLTELNDIHSAADKLRKQLAGVEVSSLQSMRMDVEEQSDIVGPLRRMTNYEQPGLFDDGSAVEASLKALRDRFESNPLLRYSDLFTLSFTVIGEDGKTHKYRDFTQVESHGTTITVKVLFSLLVLRSLLREDANKSLMCQIPFFLDEIHSLDGTNRHSIVYMARKLGFIAITAAPASISEVDMVYYLQPRKGRIVLRSGHRINVKKNGSQA